MGHFLVPGTARTLITLMVIATNIALIGSSLANDDGESTPIPTPSLLNVWIEEPVASRPCSALVRGGSTGISSGTGKLHTVVKSDLPEGNIYVVKWVVQEPAFVNPDGTWQTQITLKPCEHLFFTTFRICPILYDGPPGKEYDDLPGTQAGACVQAPQLEWALLTDPDERWWDTVIDVLRYPLFVAIASAIVGALVAGAMANILLRRHAARGPAAGLEPPTSQSQSEEQHQRR